MFLRSHSSRANHFPLTTPFITHTRFLLVLRVKVTPTLITTILTATYRAFARTNSHQHADVQVQNFVRLLRREILPYSPLSVRRLSHSPHRRDAWSATRPHDGFVSFSFSWFFRFILFAHSHLPFMLFHSLSGLFDSLCNTRSPSHDDTVHHTSLIFELRSLFPHSIFIPIDHNSNQPACV